MDSSESLVKPVAGLVFGTVALITAFAFLSRIPGWADRHGAILVYFLFFLTMSIAGRLFWVGADAVIARLRNS